MRKTKTVLVFGGMVLGLAAALLEPSGTSVAKADRSMDHCIQPVSTEWGACGNADGVKVQLRNTCAEAVRLHWCVREKSGRLHCGVHPSLAPRASSEARACQSERPPEVLFEACGTGDRCRVSTGG